MGYYERRSSSRRRSRRRSDRRVRERRFETNVFLLIFAVFAIAAVVPDVSADLVAIAGGALLTFSAFYQTSRGWRVNMFTWLGGLVLLGLWFVYSYQRQPIPGGLLLPIGILIFVVGASFLNGEL